MNQSLYMRKPVVRFRRWSRKGYAVFCSLTAQVTIGRVCKSICEMALRKSGRGLCRQGGCGLLCTMDEEVEGTEHFDVCMAEGMACLEQRVVLLPLSRPVAGGCCSIVIYQSTIHINPRRLEWS